MAWKSLCTCIEKINPIPSKRPMTYSKPKIHLQIQEFQTICGAHKTVKTCAVSEVIEQVTCGNCLRKYTVFKWNPENPRRINQNHSKCSV